MSGVAIPVATSVKRWHVVFNTIYRVIQEESAILWEIIVCVILNKNVHKNMGPILDGYRVLTA